MADHKVVVTRDERGLARLAEYRPLCSDSCEGWIECNEAHEVEGRSAADGPYETDEGDPWDGRDEYEFHGVLHELHAAVERAILGRTAPAAARAVMNVMEHYVVLAQAAVLDALADDLYGAASDVARGRAAALRESLGREGGDRGEVGDSDPR